MTDDLMGFCWENQFETVKNFFLYDPARGAEGLVRGAILQPLRVYTPPVGGWNDIFLLTFCLHFVAWTAWYDDRIYPDSFTGTFGI